MVIHRSLWLALLINHIIELSGGFEKWRARGEGTSEKTGKFQDKKHTKCPVKNLTNDWMPALPDR